MAVRYEDQCCNCSVPGYPCIGNSCPNRHVKILECDKCHDEVDKLYIFDGMELCEDCLLKEFEVIEL